MAAPRQRRPDASQKRDINDLTDLRAGIYCRVSLASREDQKKALKEGLENVVAKQTEDQKKAGLEWAKRARVDVVGVYSDADISASRYTNKERPDFKRLIADIKSGVLEVVWFWELSRSQRKLSVFAQLRDLCRDAGVLWVIRDRVYDPDAYMDMLAPTIMAAMDEVSSEQTSERVTRGKNSTALKGKPAGIAPYGYRRIYDPLTREFIRQEPDTYDGNGRPVDDSPAYIVREIYQRILAGEPIRSICRDLNGRGVRMRRRKSPTGGMTSGELSYMQVRDIARSPSYIARRVHQGKVLEGVTAVWPPLVDEETWWAVQRILGDETRRKYRPSRTRSLLSYIARCGKCGGPLAALPERVGTQHRTYGRRTYRCQIRAMYHCDRKACVGTPKDDLDDLVERTVVQWLSDPDVYAELTRVDNSAAAAAARADADQARIELEGWRKAAEAGQITLVMAGRAERGLLARISDAEQRVLAATLPTVLHGRIGPETEAAWERSDVEIKRQIIRTVADIRVQPVGRGRRVPIRDRVTWRWLLGPDANSEQA